ncbi:MAG: putative NADH:ubiquinone oxidoreductase, subunit RnfA, partial [Oscillospiraceae bacterium]|nr:putative NADH:ubiquinone oxidoreductase, subunit RnfA [Oscillospiraceae bacterium]
SFWGFFTDYISFALIAIFVENTIFTRALGASTSLLVIRKRFNYFWFGIIITVITTVSSIIVYFINDWLIKDLANKYYVTPLIYVLIIAFVYIFVLVITNRFFNKHKSKILPMVHLSAFNSAVLGALLLGSQSNMTLSAFLGFGLGTGIGFFVATYLVDIAYERLNSNLIPKAFRGFPATLLYIGILSLAFYGLIGHELPF